MVLAEDTPVFSSDGELGEVKRVLADAEADIFDGLIVDTDDGDRFVDAPNVAELYERAVVLTLSADDAQHMPEPTRQPGLHGADARRHRGRHARRHGRPPAAAGLGPDLRELLRS